MHYVVSYSNPSLHYIDIVCTIDNLQLDETEIILPTWRPGRYELGNFAKNIKQFFIEDAAGNAIKFKKISKNKWLVDTKNVSTIIVKYNYYAAELNGGSTWLDENQIYINPVNCFIYQHDKLDFPCTLELRVPANYKLASGLKNVCQVLNDSTANFVMQTIDYHQLADSPLIASATIQNNFFVLDGVEFHIWLQGECKPDWPKIIGDFFIFINEQFVLFKSFPKEDYHFLIQVLPFHFYHGVEHNNSTVIAIGPSYALMQRELYNELLGVSSHELFHTWNVKLIRPKEMLPYNYEHENYARTGYIYEGVTTYYGDLLLYRSGIFIDEEYLKTITSQVQKHFDNSGRLNMSVASASFDTWLDGYVPGVPNRKVSIYTEGCLLGLMTDVLVRKQTGNKKSLDDVMRTLYEDFGKTGIGYTADDYQTILENITTQNWNSFFEQYINGVVSYKELLKECLRYLGLELSVVAAKKPYESLLGFKVLELGNEAIIVSIFPGSEAENIGLCLKDTVIAINGFSVQNNLTEWCNYFWNETIQLTVKTEAKLRTVTLKPSQSIFYKTYLVLKNDEATSEEKENYTAWCGRKF